MDAFYAKMDLGHSLFEGAFVRLGRILGIPTLDPYSELQLSGLCGLLSDVILITCVGGIPESAALLSVAPVKMIDTAVDFCAQIFCRLIHSISWSPVARQLT